MVFVHFPLLCAFSVASLRQQTLLCTVCWPLYLDFRGLISSMGCYLSSPIFPLDFRKTCARVWPAH